MIIKIISYIYFCLSIIFVIWNISMIIEILKKHNIKENLSIIAGHISIIIIMTLILLEDFKII